MIFLSRSNLPSGWHFKCQNAGLSGGVLIGVPDKINRFFSSRLPTGSWVNLKKSSILNVHIFSIPDVRIRVVSTGQKLDHV